jgi:hypothetical protein
MYFDTKNTLKNNRNHTLKQTLNHLDESITICFYVLKIFFNFFCFKLIFLNHFDI